VKSLPGTCGVGCSAEWFGRTIALIARIDFHQSQLLVYDQSDAGAINFGITLITITDMLHGIGVYHLHAALEVSCGNADIQPHHHIFCTIRGNRKCHFLEVFRTEKKASRHDDAR
jgi:hypothetical protein